MLMNNNLKLNRKKDQIREDFGRNMYLRLNRKMYEKIKNKKFEKKNWS